jgi:hypothetical protein
MVVANSTARLALTYKYDGLKVFQTDNRNTYLYNSGSSTWNIESSGKISGTGSTNYIPKFTGTNSTTGSWEIGDSPISASGSSVGINTNNQRGSYTYLQIGGTSLTEDPYWYAGQSLPLTIHKGGTTIIGYNWYWTGSANAYFNSAVGSSQILFSDDMAFKTRPGSGSFVYNMIINPGYVIFSNDIPSGSTKSPMIRSQGSTSYSTQTTPDFTWYGDNTTGIFMPSANTIAFTNNGTQSVIISTAGVNLTGQLAVYDNALADTSVFINTNATFSSSLFAFATSRSAGTTAFFMYGVANSVNTFNVYNNGNVQNTNNSYGAISDIKLKENVVNATPKLDKLMQVRVVNYNFKENSGYESFKQIGVIAQELENIFPGLVEETPDRDEKGEILETTTKSIKYSVFVPMLIKAIQEQQAQIEGLKSQVASLINK